MFPGQFNWGGKGTEKPRIASRIACETWKWIQGFLKIAGYDRVLFITGSQIHFQVFKVINPVRWSWGWDRWD